MPNQISKKISAAEANGSTQANAANPDFTLLDVRTPSEFSEGHLAGVMMVDHVAGNFKGEAAKLNKYN